MEHYNLPSKEQPPVDYSTGKFSLLHASLCLKLLQNIKCSERKGQELSAEFFDTIGHTSKITLKFFSCSWVAGESHPSPRTEAKPRFPFLVNQRIVNSVHSIGLGFATLE